MAYFVLHSTDPFLLARMATDLQLAGKKNDWEWNDLRNPLENKDYAWMTIGNPEEPLGTFQFFSHPCLRAPHTTRFTLTESNYLTVLTKILCEK